MMVPIIFVLPQVNGDAPDDCIPASRYAGAQQARRYEKPRCELSGFGGRCGVGCFDFLEVDTLLHRQALQIAAQAVESHFDRAETDPVTAADDPAAPRCDVGLGRNCDTNGSADIDAVRAFVHVDQDRHCVSRARLTPHRSGNGLGALPCNGVHRGRAIEAYRAASLTSLARHEVATYP